MNSLAPKINPRAALLWLVILPGLFAQDITTGLVGRYPLDGDGRDLSGQPNPLVMTNVQPTTDRNGTPGGAVYLNGTTAWMVSTNDYPISGAQPRTISVWIKSDDFAFYRGNPVVIGLGDKSSERTLFDVSLNGSARAFVHGSWLTAISTTGQIQPQKWIHIAVTTAGVLNTVRIYYDGTLAAMSYDDGRTAINQPIPYATVSRKLRVSTGSTTSGPVNDSFIWWTQGFKGSMDDIRIYNRQLSDADVAELYRQASGINSPPAILTQPAPQTLLVGQPLQLSVTASGAAPLSYQWLRSGTVLAGATTATYAVANATLTDAGTYSVLVTNSLGSTYSSTAAVTVAQPAAPAITVQPQPLSVVTGGTATFSVEVSAAPAPTFQWLRNGTPLAGATNRILTLTNLSAANAGTYAVTVSNTLGTTLSSPATLTITLPVTAPTFTSQPSSQSATVGATVVLTAGVSANPAPAFQWLRNGVQLPGATNSSLLIPAAAPGDAGSYQVIASNAAGTVNSATATLTVIPGSALSNLSVRTTLPAGQTLIVGAVVSGGPKSILLRAAGPALNKFGLVGMVDPRLELYTGTTLVGSNDTWASSLTTTFSRVGAFAFDPGSLDAALNQSISGAFTVQTRGSGPGTVLVEAYDAAGGVTPRLVNLSARNQVGSGADILIAGFALSGSGTKQVLVRAIGPTLAVFGVGGALADPRLTLLSGAGATLAENDNWGTPVGSAAAVASAIFTQVGAFPLPAGSRDAALLITLNAGASYTVQVAGVNNTTGEALIEVYEVF